MMEKATEKFDKEAYDRLKRKVKRLENKNFSKLILFESGGEWYEMGGNSLLIYAFEIMKPFFHKKVGILRDTDYGTVTFPDGVISFRGTEAIERRLKTADVLKERREGGGAVIFELTFSVTPDTIIGRRAELKTEAERVNRLIRPQVAIEPEIYTTLRHIQGKTYTAMRKSAPLDRAYNGNLIAAEGREMMKLYLKINNGTASEAEGWRELLRRVSDLMLEVSFCVELNIWETSTAVALQSDLREVKRRLERKLKV